MITRVNQKRLREHVMFSRTMRGLQVRITTCEQISALCATEPRLLAPISALSLMWTTFLMYSLAIVSKQITQSWSVLVELEVLLLRAFHVHNVLRVVVRL